MPIIYYPILVTVRSLQKFVEIRDASIAFGKSFVQYMKYKDGGN